MRVAQIAPLWESVPPTAYGAIESLVASLSQQLVSAGHQVTVFAAGDSKVSGRLVASHPASLNADSAIFEPEAIRLTQLVDVLERAADFDILHAHLHSNSGLSRHSSSTPSVPRPFIPCTATPTPTTAGS